jgi:hypothetical protein
MRTWWSVFMVTALAVPLDASAQAQQTNPPYTVEDVLVLVQGGHSAARILTRVSADCISFRVDGAAADLRRAGADDALLEGLRKVCVRVPSRTLEKSSGPTPTQQRGVLRIEGELPPGWMRKVNELPPNTNREIEMTPGRRNFITVSAPGWCPATKEVSVQAGEQGTWTPVLRARPWVGECSEDA